MESVRGTVRRVPVMVRVCLAVAAVLCLTAGAFVLYEERQYQAGHDYGQRTEIISVHVFDGDFPGGVPADGDLSSYEDDAERECAEHGADDDASSGSRRWLDGCVDAVLGR